MLTVSTLSTHNLHALIACERATRHSREARTVEALARTIAYRVPEAADHLPADAHVGEPAQILQRLADALGEVWRERGLDPVRAAFDEGLPGPTARALFPDER